MLGILRWKEERGGGGAETLCGVTANQLTLFHHADVDAALETTGLAVAPVVLGDGAAPVERTGEGGFTLHAAPAGGGWGERRRGEESGENDFGFWGQQTGKNNCVCARTNKQIDR